MYVSEEELNKRKQMYEAMKNKSNGNTNLYNTGCSYPDPLDNSLEHTIMNPMKNPQVQQEDSMRNYKTPSYVYVHSNNVQPSPQMPNGGYHNFNEFMGEDVKGVNPSIHCEFEDQRMQMNRIKSSENENKPMYPVTITHENRSGMPRSRNITHENMRNHSTESRGNYDSMEKYEIRNQFERRNNSEIVGIQKIPTTTSNNMYNDSPVVRREKNVSIIITTGKSNESINTYPNMDMSSIYRKYDKNGQIYCKKIKFYIKNERVKFSTYHYIVKINCLKDSCGKQYMRLELSDDQKESFFYHYNLFEDDYEKLKKEQTLVMDFNVFPFKFIELLEECVYVNEQCEESEDQRLKAMLIFESKCKGMVPETRSSYYDSNIGNYAYQQNEKERERIEETAILNLVEINQFKELTHISLILKKGDHENTMQHLSRSLKYVKEFSTEILNKLNDEIVRNHKNSMEIQKLEGNIDQLENGIRTLKVNFNNTMSNDMNSLKGKYEEEINTMKEEHKKQLEQKEEKFQTQIEELKNDLETYKKKLNDLNTLYENNENENFNMSREIKALKNELEEKKTMYLKVMKEKEDVESEKSELEKYKNSMIVEYNTLKSKYEKECESNISNSSSYENIKLSNSTLESDLKKYKERNGKLEKELTIAIDEINKGNDIIGKLQTQLKKMKDKLKSKVLEHGEIEKTNAQHVSDMTKLQNEMNQIQAQLHEKIEAEEQFKKEVELLKRKNEEIMKELNISREVNLRLNKEITNKSLDQYITKIGNVGTGPTASSHGINQPHNPNIGSGTNFPIDTNLLDKDFFNKLKANIKNPSTVSYTSENNTNNINLLTGKIASLDINDRYNKPVKFIPPNI